MKKTIKAFFHYLFDDVKIRSITQIAKKVKVILKV